MRIQNFVLFFHLSISSIREEDIAFKLYKFCLLYFLEDFCLWCQRFQKKSFCQSLGKTMPMIFKVLLLIFQNLTFFPQNLRSSTSFKGCSSAMTQNENLSHFKELTSFSSKVICNYETCLILLSISG